MLGSSEDPAAANETVLGSDFTSSFQEFCARPENARLVGKSQRADLRAGLRLAANAAAERFRESFLALPPPLQRNLAPYLEVPFLRRVVQTLANDERGDFAQWAGNPRILEVLAATKEALHTGRLTEVEAERLLLAQAKDPALNPEAELFKERTRLVATLDTSTLVGALNEALRERWAGNAAYRTGRLGEAAAAYARSLAVLDHVRGAGAGDQAEVLKNKAAVLWNLAAVHLAAAEPFAAIQRCTTALEECAPADEQRLRLLLRRAAAHVARREYAAAARDLEAVKEAEPWNEEAERVAARATAQRAADGAKDRAFAAAALRKA